MLGPPFTRCGLRAAAKARSPATHVAGVRWWRRRATQRRSTGRGRAAQLVSSIVSFDLGHRRRCVDFGYGEPSACAESAEGRARDGSQSELRASIDVRFAAVLRCVGRAAQVRSLRTRHGSRGVRFPAELIDQMRPISHGHDPWRSAAFWELLGPLADRVTAGLGALEPRACVRICGRAPAMAERPCRRFYRCKRPLFGTAM